MNTEYPANETYDALYARYRENPLRLLNMMDVTDKVVWDLCCGAGDMAMAAVKRKAKKVIAVDRSLEMYPRGGPQTKRLHKTHFSVEEFVSSFQFETADVVLCRQGVNYWFDKKTVQMLADKMSSGGVFVFNTFNTKPSVIPTVKEYDFHGKRFIEVSWLVGKMVNHVQIREGMEPHHTEFRWISPLEFGKVLCSAFAEVKENVDGRTTTYVCVKGNK